MPAIAIGSVIALNSGGPNLTFTEHKDLHGTLITKVMWFDAQLHLQELQLHLQPGCFEIVRHAPNLD